MYIIFIRTLGDAYRFTLQPIFLNPSTQFRCHLVNRRPSVLYRLWFYITVPGTNFETPRIYATVRPSAFKDFTSGRFNLQFISLNTMSDS